MLVAIAFAALARHSGSMLLGTPSTCAPVVRVPATVAAALVLGVLASSVLGITAGPLSQLFTTAATHIGVPR